MAPTVSAAKASPTKMTFSAKAADLGSHRDGLDRISAASAAQKSADIRLNLLVNARYHSAREAYLDRAHRWLMFGVILFGAGAFANVVGPRWQPFVALAPVLCGALDLVFDLSGRARSHSFMKRRYFELLAEFAEGRKSVLQANACATRFNAEEEPAFQALLKLCWNATEEAERGERANCYKISWFQNLTKNLLSHEAASFSHKETSNPEI